MEIMIAFSNSFVKTHAVYAPVSPAFLPRGPYFSPERNISPKLTARNAQEHQIAGAPHASAATLPSPAPAAKERITPPYRSASRSRFLSCERKKAQSISVPLRRLPMHTVLA